MGLIREKTVGNWQLIARLDQIETDRHGRTVLLFDAIRDDLIDWPRPEWGKIFGDDAPEARKAFALVRAMPDDTAFAALSERVRPHEGQWFWLELAPDASTGAMPCEYAALGENGYSQHIQGFISGLDLLIDEETAPQPRPLGASVPTNKQKGQAVKSAAAFPAAAPSFSRIGCPPQRWHFSATKITVRDVGQAAFVTLDLDLHWPSAVGNNHFNLRVPLHYDAGWPVSFHDDTAPLPQTLNVQPGIVVLSHWDWDHMHGFYRFAALPDSSWIAPDRPMGPGAGRVAQYLHKHQRLWRFDRKRLRLPWICILTANGPPKDANQSGLAMVVKLADGRRALLTGDADYARLPSPFATDDYDFIVATHHGARFAGHVVTPAAPGCRAVISAGLGNYYGHPTLRAMLAHARAKWQLEATFERKKQPRGDREWP